MKPMTTAQFRTLRDRDFENGAVRDEIWTALRSREDLLDVLTRLLEWADILGGWDANVWNEARELVREAGPGRERTR